MFYLLHDCENSKIPFFAPTHKFHSAKSICKSEFASQWIWIRFPQPLKSRSDFKVFRRGRSSRLETRPLRSESRWLKCQLATRSSRLIPESVWSEERRYLDVSFEWVIIFVRKSIRWTCEENWLIEFYLYEKRKF